MTDLPKLTAEEQRVLGALLEKERTVPATYPLSLNALRTACNQTSSRDPVVEYDERHVAEIARSLKERGLLRIVWADTGRRTLKYHQALSELLDLAEDERALLTVLLLRGEQAPGELRTRTERLHAFPDRTDVEACLARMAGRGLVVELARRAGERDARWRHLLTTDAPEPAASPAPTVDLATRDERVRAAYDAVAQDYADAWSGELADMPFERWLLEHVADLAGPAPVVEVGCGPGHVTAYLAELGVDARGIDASSAMVEQARRRYPDGRYDVGDLRSLLRPATADGWGAILAWYSLVHHTAEELPEILTGLARPLRPGGWLVWAGHAGTEVRHRDEWFEHPVDVDVVSQEPAAVAGWLERAGLLDVHWHRRSPIPGSTETTERAYVLGRRG